MPGHLLIRDIPLCCPRIQDWYIVQCILNGTNSYWLEWCPVCHGQKVHSWICFKNFRSIGTGNIEHRFSGQWPKGAMSTITCTHICLLHDYHNKWANYLFCEWMEGFMTQFSNVTSWLMQMWNSECLQIYLLLTPGSFEHASIPHQSFVI